MDRAVTEPHPLWATVHAPKIKFQEPLSQKSCLAKCLCLLPCTLWVGGFLSPGSKQFQKQNRYQEIMIISLLLSKSLPLSGPQFPLEGWGLKQLLRVPPSTLWYSRTIRSCRLNSQGPWAFSSLLLKVYLAQISPWVSAGACLPVLWNSEALQVMIVYLPS